MLQNLNYDKKKEKSWKRWNKQLRKNNLIERQQLTKKELIAHGNEWYEKHPSILGYKRFRPYKPCGLEYTRDFYTNFTGVYIMAKGYGFYSPFQDISTCTRSHSDGYGIIYGLCDNASQVIDLYNALFCGAKYNGNPEILHTWEKYRDFHLESYATHPNNKWAKRDALFWQGNHVIILKEMNDFRWHKWGIYLGNFEPKCEYFSEEEGIEHIYSFTIYKVF